MVGTETATSLGAQEGTTVGVFFAQARRLGEQPLFYQHQGTNWDGLTWNQSREQVLKIATALLRAGVAPGQPVILMSSNRLEWLLCDLAIQSLGAITVPLYPNSTPATVAAIVANCEAAVAIVGDSALAAQLPVGGSLDRIFLMTADVRNWIDGPLSGAEAADVESLVAETGPDDICTIIYTSGTTGEPKGVVLLHRNLTDQARAGLACFSLGPDDVILSFLPYAHVFERVSSIFVGITAGCRIYIARGPDHLLEDLQQVRPTVMCGVPRIYEKVHSGVQARVRTSPVHRRTLFAWALSQGTRKNLAGRGGPAFELANRLVLAKLRKTLTGGRIRVMISGGAPLAREVEEFFWALGIPILQGWGLTETSSGATTNRLDQHHFGSVGWALASTEIRIAEDGEILVRGPGVMAGYYKDPESTAKALQGGWFHTGDIGTLNLDGCLTITDRKKDLIKTTGGKLVAPQPIEAQLQQDPLIDRVVLVGDGRHYVVALVVPSWAYLSTRGMTGNPLKLVHDQDVIALVQERIDSVNSGRANWEQIKYFRLIADDFSIEAGELTPKMSIRRRQIQENHRQLIDEMYRSRSA